MRVRRSLLFAAGAEPASLAAAQQSAADAVLLDLEDTVTPARKAAARTLVAEALRQRARPGLERAVRINAPGTPWAAEDVDAVVAAGAEALLVPKAEAAHDVERVARDLAEAERRHGRPPGAVRLLALVETPLGVLNAHPIAGASPRLEALVIGHVDLARALGLREAGAMAGTILHARCQLVLAARAAGRAAVDAVFMNVDDPEGFVAEARQGLALGFSGKLLIDERQVDLLHEAYRPSEAEVAYARRLLAAWDAAVAAGRGVFVFEGRVIDRPVVEAERSVLARAGTDAP